MLKMFFPSCISLEPQYKARKINWCESKVSQKEKAWPRISIVIPSFNQGHFIGATIDSILNQRYPNLELILVDGGSSDQTLSVLKKYEEHISHLIIGKDTGQTNAINIGFSVSTGEIMAWLNSDDMYMPNSIFKVASEFKRSSELELVYGHRKLVNQHSEDIGVWITYQQSLSDIGLADFVPQETLFWRRSLWDRCGGFVDEKFNFAMDWELLLRFYSHGAKVKLINSFIGAFRVHDQQKSQKYIVDIGFEEMDRLRGRWKEKYNKETNEKLYFYKSKFLLLLYLFKCKAVELAWKLGVKKID